jgi:hypothetical protein
MFYFIIIVVILLIFIAGGWPEIEDRNQILVRELTGNYKWFPRDPDAWRLIKHMTPRDIVNFMNDKYKTSFIESDVMNYNSFIRLPASEKIRALTLLNFYAPMFKNLKVVPLYKDPQGKSAEVPVGLHFIKHDYDFLAVEKEMRNIYKNPGDLIKDEASRNIVQLFVPGAELTRNYRPNNSYREYRIISNQNYNHDMEEIKKYMPITGRIIEDFCQKLISNGLCSNINIAFVMHQNNTGLYSHIDDLEKKIGNSYVFNINRDIYYDMFPWFVPGRKPVRVKIPAGKITEFSEESRFLWSHSIPEGIPNINGRMGIILRTSKGQDVIPYELQGINLNIGRTWQNVLQFFYVLVLDEFFRKTNPTLEEFNNLPGRVLEAYKLLFQTDKCIDDYEPIKIMKSFTLNVVKNRNPSKYTGWSHLECDKINLPGNFEVTDTLEQKLCEKNIEFPPDREFVALDNHGKPVADGENHKYSTYGPVTQYKLNTFGEARTLINIIHKSISNQESSGGNRHVYSDYGTGKAFLGSIINGMYKQKLKYELGDKQDFYSDKNFVCIADCKHVSKIEKVTSIPSFIMLPLQQFDKSQDRKKWQLFPYKLEDNAGLIKKYGLFKFKIGKFVRSGKRITTDKKSGIVTYKSVLFSSSKFIATGNANQPFIISNRKLKENNSEIALPAPGIDNAKSIASLILWKLAPLTFARGDKNHLFLTNNKILAFFLNRVHKHIIYRLRSLKKIKDHNLHKILK